MSLLSLSRARSECRNFATALESLVHVQHVSQVVGRSSRSERVDGGRLTCKRSPTRRRFYPESRQASARGRFPSAVHQGETYCPTAVCSSSSFTCRRHLPVLSEFCPHHCRGFPQCRDFDSESFQKGPALARRCHIKRIYRTARGRVGWTTSALAAHRGSRLKQPAMWQCTGRFSTSRV